MEYGFNDWWNTLTATGAVSRFTYSLNGNNYVDPRASLTFYSDPALGGDADWAGGAYDFRAKRTSWKKYNRYETLVNESIPDSDINTQLIRYADVLLMIAECHIFMDNYAAALPYINQVRERVGATPYAAAPNSFDQAFDILKRERRLEFTGEQIRWFDLKRWELAAKKASGYSMIKEINDDRALDMVNKPGPMQEKYIWFPIPNVEVQNNPELNNSLYFPDWN